MTKICKMCKQEKQIECFSLNSECAGGRSARCKTCINEMQRSKWNENKEQKAIQRSERRKKNIDKYREAERKNRKSYREKNKNEVNRKYREYMRKYRKEKIDFRLNKYISYVVKYSLDSRCSTHDIFCKLGYSIQDLINHIESKFTEGMTWDNYGEWHIDHIIPKSWLPFTSLNDENFIKCWQLSNLQPLWAKDNISKNNRYSGSPENPTAFLYDLNFLQTQRPSCTQSEE